MKNWLKIRFEVLKHTISEKNFVGILWVGCLLVIIYYFNKYFVGKDFSGKDLSLPQFWTNVLDPTITVFSFLFPLILSFYLLKKEWEESLETKLIVHFSIKNNGKKEYVMSCYNVNLLPYADMRSLGQQIGGQMSGDFQLKFNPSIQPISNGIISVKNEKNKLEWVKYYEIEFLLATEPISSRPETIKNLRGLYLVWNLFDEDKELIYFNQRYNQTFHNVPKFKKEISISELLSFDKKSLENFKKCDSLLKNEQQKS